MKSDSPVNVVCDAGRSYRVQRTREEVLSILHELPTCSTLYISAKLLQQVISEVEYAPH